MPACPPEIIKKFEEQGCKLKKHSFVDTNIYKN